MDKRQVEVRVLTIVDHVIRGGKIEDDFVEGKARWTDAKKTARQIAGSANAARGEPILWIVGLDEDGHRVVELDGTEPSSWWEQVKKRFADGMTPAVQFVGVPTPAGFVMVLVFETDQSPYLVTTDGTGGIEREVPWREGTRVRSVRRAELLRLLTSRSAVPAVEAISLELSLRRGAGLHDPDTIGLSGELFFSVHTQVMLPKHLWALTFSTDGNPDDRIPMAPKFAPHRTSRAVLNSQLNVIGGRGAMPVEEPEQSGIQVRHGGLALDSSDSIRLTAQATSHRGVRSLAYEPTLNLSLAMPLDRDDRAVTLDIPLEHQSSRPTDQDAGIESRWVLPQRSRP